MVFYSGTEGEQQPSLANLDIVENYAQVPKTIP